MSGETQWKLRRFAHRSKCAGHRRTGAPAHRPTSSIVSRVGGEPCSPQTLELMRSLQRRKRASRPLVLSRANQCKRVAACVMSMNGATRYSVGTSTHRGTFRDPQNKNPVEPKLYGVFSTIAGGDGGIRTLDPGFGPDAPLAGECLRPLGHVSQTFGRARESARRSQDNSGFRQRRSNPLDDFYPAIHALVLPAKKPATPLQASRHHARQRSQQTAMTQTGNIQTARIKPDRVQTPCAARARPVPCISRRSAPRS